MATRTRHGRRQLDRPGIAAHIDAAEKTVEHWHLNRAETRFPDKADTDQDGRDWWWKDEIDTFHTAYRAARAATFTSVNRHGEPDDLLTAPEAAKVLGYRNHRSLPAVLLDNPDQADELPSGRIRRRWHRRTIWAYADSRTDRHSTGRPPGTTNPDRQPHPYADDPRLSSAIELLEQATAAGTTKGLGARLAHQLGISERAGQRLITAARQVHITGNADRVCSQN